ncbi:MAG: TolC family outer membrane protein [Parvibaculaceae bacterium]|nr:TolC family outer membrane protein [Parvibaculaceae bacterium]
MKRLVRYRGVQGLVRAALVTTALSGWVLPARAETITDAFTAAYESNPGLQGQRAQQRATDEQVPQALSGYRPNASVQASYGLEHDQQVANTGGQSSRLKDDFQPATGTVTLGENLYSGGQTVNSVQQAEAAVRAGREQLLGVEQGTLMNAASAYLTVIQNEATVKLQENNVQVLQRQLEANQDRFKVGILTTTDVAQSVARLADSKSQLTGARAQLDQARAEYLQVIGHMPGTLERPAPITGLPASKDAAVAVALATNPDIKAAREAERASSYAIKVAEGSLLPKFDVQAQYQQYTESALSVDRGSGASLMGVLTVPLYQGGAEYSQIRESKALNSQSRLQISATTDAVVQNVSNAWDQLQSAKAQFVSGQEAVRANQLALEGTRQEELVGSRTILDVLNAEQELLNSQVNLVRYDTNIYIFGYNLLATMGRLGAKDLNLPVPYYDSTKNYDDVRDSWFGTSSEGQ